MLDLWLPDPTLAQWVSQSSGTKQTLHDVCFVDSLFGWAVGDSGLILHTSDSGLNWYPQIWAKTIPLLSISFCDVSTGWAGGYLATVLRTTNGGTTWLQSVLDTAQNVRCLKVQALSDSDCVALTDRFYGDYWGGSRLFRTSDAGASWTDVSPYPASFGYISDMDFISPYKAFACGFGGVPHARQIIRTDDGGFSWNTYDFDAPTIGSVYRLCFNDSTHGWAAADSLYYSSDGGITWNSVADIPFGSAWSLTMFGDIGWGNAWFGDIYRTSDGGKTWLAQTHYPFSVERVFFISTSFGWAVGYGGLIIHTTNGGLTNVPSDDFRGTFTSYRLYQNYPNPFNPSTVISFVAAKSGYATITLYDALGREITAPLI